MLPPRPPLGKDDEAQFYLIGFVLLVCFSGIIGAIFSYAICEFLWKLFLTGF